MTTKQFYHLEEFYGCKLKVTTKQNLFIPSLLTKKKSNFDATKQHGLSL
jgi:hypothetical protein